MNKKKFTVEQIIGKLREAEVLQSKGESIEAVCRHLGITGQTYYRWRKEIITDLLTEALPKILNI